MEYVQGEREGEKKRDEGRKGKEGEEWYKR